MVCNIVCIVFLKVLDNVDVFVINLIDVILCVMVEYGGDCLVVIVIVGIVKSGVYQNRVVELINGDIILQVVVVYKFVDFVNDFKYKSDDLVVKVEL